MQKGNDRIAACAIHGITCDGIGSHSEIGMDKLYDPHICAHWLIVMLHSASDLLVDQHLSGPSQTLARLPRIVHPKRHRIIPTGTRLSLRMLGGGRAVCLEHFCMEAPWKVSGGVDQGALGLYADMGGLSSGEAAGGLFGEAPGTKWSSGVEVRLRFEDLGLLWW